MNRTENKRPWGGSGDEEEGRWKRAGLLPATRQPFLRTTRSPPRTCGSSYGAGGRGASGFPCPGLKPACSPAPRDVSRRKNGRKGVWGHSTAARGRWPRMRLSGGIALPHSTDTAPGDGPPLPPQQHVADAQPGEPEPAPHTFWGAAASRDLLGDSLCPAPGRKGFHGSSSAEEWLLPPRLSGSVEGALGSPPSLPAPSPPPVDSFPQSQASGLALPVH